MFGFIPFNRDMRKVSEEACGGDVFDSLFGEGWAAKVMGTFRMDIEETEKEYLISADMPGVKKEEVSLKFEDDNLTISVARAEKAEDGKTDKDGALSKNFIMRERRRFSMERTVCLEDALSGGATAKMENGVLYVTVPKVEKKENTFKIDIE